MLNVDREDAIKSLNTGANLLITGAAGSGKTHLIKEFARTSKKNVALTATTGIAALNLGGETIHRFLSLGITARPEYADLIVKKWARIKKSPKPWDKLKWKLIKSVDTIVIDEASMLRRDQFELIEVVLSAVRNNSRPFGGVQMVLVGDFFQLPPVVTTSDLKQYPDLAEPFCFQSDVWNYGKMYSINLTTNYRQSDQLFLEVLNKIRLGEVDEQVNQTMAARVNAVMENDLRPVRLFPHKASVAAENISCLKKIDEPKFRSVAEYTGKKINTDALKKDCPAEEKLYFCKGAQVMMLTNEPKGVWVNGSMGKVIAVDPIEIQLVNGVVIKPEIFKWEKISHKLDGVRWVKETIATMSQYPFKLAWASSIHKSQGLTLDYIEIDISRCFTAGQSYVALSRVKSLAGLSLKSWSEKVIYSDDRVKEFYKIKETK